MDIINCFQSGMIILRVLENNHFSLLYFNDGFAALVGYSSEEFQTAMDQGMDLVELIYPADRKRISKLIAKVAETEHASEMHRLLDKQGNAIWVLAEYKESLYEDEHVLCIVVLN